MNSFSGRLVFRCVFTGAAAVLALALLLLSAPIAADYSIGGTNTPVDRRGWQRFWEETRSARYQRYDENYERGKAVYLGIGAHEKFAYCVRSKKDPGKLVPLTWRSANPLRKIPVQQFVHKLYDCNTPETKILTRLNPRDAGAVVYYLNSRYKLRLEQQSVARRPSQQQAIANVLSRDNVQ